MGPPVRPSPLQHHQALDRENDTIGWDEASASPLQQQETEAEKSQVSGRHGNNQVIQKY